MTGPFIAVVGPSGAGKDSLIAGARAILGEGGNCHFPRWIVTRPAQATAEDHDSLPPDEFDRLQRAGEFPLAWSAHGLRYGLPLSLVCALAARTAVVANVSRTALGDAAAAFGALHVVYIHAPRHVLLHRILARGRETRAEAEARLDRRVPTIRPVCCTSFHRVVNAGALEVAVASFVHTLQEIRG